MNSSNQLTPVNESLQQLTNNATTWLGKAKGEKSETIMGQTFIAPKEGDLERIEVYSTIVARAGEVALTVHAFDSQNQSWGPTLSSSNLNFNTDCNGKWMSFKIPSLHLTKGMIYGFKLESHGSFIGVGEAVISAKQQPFAHGKEWKFTNNETKGASFSYFSLAFKVGLKAA